MKQEKKKKEHSITRSAHQVSHSDTIEWNTISKGVDNKVQGEFSCGSGVLTIHILLHITLPSTVDLPSMTKHILHQVFQVTHRKKRFGHSSSMVEIAQDLRASLNQKPSEELSERERGLGIVFFFFNQPTRAFRSKRELVRILSFINWVESMDIEQLDSKQAYLGGILQPIQIVQNTAFKAVILVQQTGIGDIRQDPLDRTGIVVGSSKELQLTSTVC